MKRYRFIWNFDVHFRPFFLGGIMSGSGNQPPALVPNRAVFLARDLDRNIAWFNLKFLGMPQNFFSPEVMRSTIWLNRLLCLVVTSQSFSNDEKWKIIECAFSIIWETKRFRNLDNEFIGSVDQMVEELKSVLGQSVHTRVLSLLGDIGNGGKMILSQNTKDALSIHAFGSPIFYFPKEKDNIIFFGSDRFEQIAFLFNLPWYGPRGPGVVIGSSKL